MPICIGMIPRRLTSEAPLLGTCRCEARQNAAGATRRREGARQHRQPGKRFVDAGQPFGHFRGRKPFCSGRLGRADSRLTHPHQVCQDACAVFVAAIATAIAEGSSPQDCYRAALDEAHAHRWQPRFPSAYCGSRAATRRLPEEPRLGADCPAKCLLSATARPKLGRRRGADGNARWRYRHQRRHCRCAAGGRSWPGRDPVAVASQRPLCRPLANSGTAHIRPAEFRPVDVLFGGETTRPARLLRKSQARWPRWCRSSPPHSIRTSHTAKRSAKTNGAQR